ncbi:ribonuclease R [Clostridium cylindrosporum]|uniref:Ribonuclease R n=1 Tax=Clostridium cylindrosporum DSM 605 TaxID=1121307 RepID=A0A0J8D4Q2_CLOCY|nr:ribonuclease R [Clostridium cylindrosporum]KMT20797.1 ribonuclease R [Clostridium cylindrosporum DSM 605]
MSKIKEQIIAFMREEAYKPLKAQEIALIFDIGKKDMPMFIEILDSMEAEGLVIKTRKEKYASPDRLGLIRGKLQGNAKGFGFVIPDSEEADDLFIPLENMNGAMNGDEVIAKVVRDASETGKRTEGEIVRIVKRANTKVVGTFEKSGYFGFVVPDDKRIYQDIFISKNNIQGAKTGEKVVAEITVWPENRRNPEGKVVEILGHKDDLGVDIISIIKKYNLPEEFPKKVEEYAENIPEQIPAEDYKGRRDLRDLKIVTIDGEDAKDLDDAISIERLSGGRFKLGVHIADVSHYVRENNVLDKEAYNRATSIYLVDRVIPMLPRKLSNGICSLNPRVDRLTMTCMMIIDENGRVLEHEVFESVIKTSERMTYTDVTKILRDDDPELKERYDYLLEEFNMMKELCEILNKKRMGRGAIDFDFEECKIILDEEGKPIDIKPYEREIANRIIEEFMLVCNETIAEYMFWTGLPFVYRIHEKPNDEKLLAFGEFIYNLGYYLRPGKEVHPKSLQKILEEVKGKDEEQVVSTLLLRSLKKAKYFEECIGHYGLAAKYYCHFTSPIRRYPDLVIHRIIKWFLHGEIDTKKESKLKKFVVDASKQSSEMERLAQEAERETDDLKKAEYMLDRIGEVYDGIISSVTSFGIFVELENTIEGLVHISHLSDDYYIYDESKHLIMGEATKKTYKLGQKLKVKVSKVDVETRSIDFSLVKETVEE